MSTEAPQPSEAKTTQKHVPRVLLVILTALLVTWTLIDALTSSMTPDSADIARPAQVVQPYDNKACTVEIEATEPDQPPNQAIVTCGDETQTLAGDFRDQSTNHYNPATTDGITGVIAVGDERRVWIEHDDITCTIIWTEGDDPARCELTTPTS